jgi:hypothetical protein
LPAYGIDSKEELVGIASRVRRGAILKGLDDTRMRGVEIGPLDRPLISKNESEVYYLDHCATENLKIKYARDPNVETDNIVNVDFIWTDEPVSRSLSNICPLEPV